MVITISVIPLFTYPNLPLYSHMVITVLCDLQVFPCPMNEGATRVDCTVLPYIRISGELMPFTTALLHLGPSSSQWSYSVQPSPCTGVPSPDLT
jgi:hypothetical protein